MGSYFTKKEQVVILVVVFVLLFLFGFKLISDKVLSPRAKLDLDQDPINKEETEENNKQEDISDSIIMVHISGQVHNPGIIELKQGMRLVDAVELAGGSKPEADLDRVNLAKRLADEEKVYIPAKGEEIDIGIEVGSKDPDNQGLININTCSKEDLTRLPGIGDVIAGRIVDYRSANPFKTLEDIMNVSGIGEKKFQDIKDLISVK